MFLDHRLDQYPSRTKPPWATLDPTRPRFREIERGIMYYGLGPEILHLFLTQQGTRLVGVWGAVGPDLFWGRSDGPWIPYDLEAQDQNQGCKVSDRPWPWCWGDQVWVCALWLSQPCYIRFTGWGCDLLVGSPTEEPSTDAVKVEFEATRIAGAGNLGRVPASMFLRADHDGVRA